MKNNVITKKILAVKNLKDRGFFDDALQKSKEMLEVAPENYQVWQQLAQIYEKKKDPAKAIECYDRAIQLNSKKEILYVQKARLLQEQGQAQHAVLAYEKAISLKNEPKAGLYKSLGDSLYQQRSDSINLRKMIEAYQRAINLNPTLSSSLYAKIVSTLLESDFPQESLKYSQRLVEEFYFINNNKGIAYCSIPKNATTLFKSIIVQNSTQKEDYRQSNIGIHKYLRRNRQNYRLKCISNLKDSNIFKFVVLRNPLDRLVSGYLDKFVKHNRTSPATRPVIEAVYQGLELPPDFNKSITFRQFIDYLVQTPDFDLDSHWRPQYTFMGLELNEFDFVGQFEKLDETIAYLKNKFDLEINTHVSPSKHVTSYNTVQINESVHELYPEELRSLTSFPNRHCFFTSKLENVIKARYSIDFQMCSML